MASAVAIVAGVRMVVALSPCMRPHLVSIRPHNLGFRLLRYLRMCVCVMVVIVIIVVYILQKIFMKDLKKMKKFIK